MKILVSQERIEREYTSEKFYFIYAIAFSIASFAWSERGKIPTFLFLMVMWLVYNDGLKSLKKNVILAILVVSVTLGHTVGFLILIFFFILFSIFSRRNTTIVYALIPIAYLIFSAHSYVISIKKYAVFALEGLQEFLDVFIKGNMPERITPWSRITSLSQSDIYITSAAYISLLLLSFLTALTSIYILLKEKNKIKGNYNAYLQTSSAYLWIFLSIVLITYVGVTTKHETSFSDIRTIVIIFILLLLPFILTSKRLIERISAKKVFVLAVTALLILATLKTIYDVYPKSIYDPINVVEDNRLGTTSIYALTVFITAHCRGGGIVADYKVLNRIGAFLSDVQYEKRFLNETTLNKPFARYPYQHILIFNTAGTVYPSIYHSQRAYIAAYNFSLSNNRLYDNGVVVISLARK
ncbi:MAG: hypothetical protein QXF61_04235 [Nitrososphaeria archaeon]